MSKNTNNALIAFIAGASMGTLTGLLIAPAKGSRTRKRIKKKLKRDDAAPADNMFDHVSELKQRIADFAEEVKDKFDSIEAQMKAQNEQVNPED
jgi:gas vesicle protein